MATTKMRHSVREQLATALVGLSLACIALGAQPAGGERFVPPNVTAAGDILYPFEVADFRPRDALIDYQWRWTTS